MIDHTRVHAQERKGRTHTHHTHKDVAPKAPTHTRHTRQAGQAGRGGRKTYRVKRAPSFPLLSLAAASCSKYRAWLARSDLRVATACSASRFRFPGRARSTRRGGPPPGAAAAAAALPNGVEADCCCPGGLGGVFPAAKCGQVHVNTPGVDIFLAVWVCGWWWGCACGVGVWVWANEGWNLKDRWRPRRFFGDSIGPCRFFEWEGGHRLCGVYRCAFSNTERREGTPSCT